MFGNMGGNNMSGMVKKMQKLQAEIAKTQEKFKTRTFETTAGGGAVKVTMNGEKKLLAIKINPDAVDPEDMEMLEDMIMAAVNEAIDTTEETFNKEMSKLTGGLPPGLL